jgi:DNA-binding transcriptional regulator YdaS (Cro superfamily)
MILTARIAEHDLMPFDLLRQQYFPQDRNFLRAHLTMFYRLPGEYVDVIGESLRSIAKGTSVISAQVSGVRHLGAGVAFTIESATLNSVRAALRSDFVQWLGSQDMQAWRPHITVQNKASRAKANELYHTLADGFSPHDITIVGLDLWRYLGGPWASEATVPFTD